MIVAKFRMRSTLRARGALPGGVERHRRRPRDSLEDEDEDRALDAMLVELGIPCGGSSCNREVPNRSASATVEIIELTTPSPPARRRNSSRLKKLPSKRTRSPFRIPVSISAAFCVCTTIGTRKFKLCCNGCYFRRRTEILSPEMTSARRQVFPDESKRAGAKQARRLSGQLKDLHSETIRGGGSARKKRKETTAASTVTVDTGARMTNSPAKSRTAASPCRSKPAVAGAKEKEISPTRREEPSKFFVIIEGMDRALIDLKKQQKKKKRTE
ncbi:hypothetical protein GQ600_27611 [Phytophthora cactorum]|nr:hypothetical protein GQ600_27611 [Phytophthora cactorum]